MNSIVLVNEFTLIGITLESKTINTDGQSMIDCGNLWQKFQNENIVSRIPGKLSEEIYAVYYDYEGDYTKPFSYFIGSRVKPGSVPPEEMISLVIPEGNFQKFTAIGKMSDCVAEAWQKIWDSDIQRSYNKDFEIYDSRSRDWIHAEVDIYISV